MDEPASLVIVVRAWREDDGVRARLLFEGVTPPAQAVEVVTGSLEETLARIELVLARLVATDDAPETIR